MLILHICLEPPLVLESVHAVLFILIFRINLFLGFLVQLDHSHQTATMTAKISLALSMLSLTLLTCVCNAKPSVNPITSSSTEGTEKNDKDNTYSNGYSTALATTISVTTHISSQPSTSSSTMTTTSPKQDKKTPSLQHTIQTSTSSTPTPAPVLNMASGIVIVLVVIVLLLLLLGLIYKWTTRQSEQEGSAPELLLGVRARLRGGVRTLEERLGLTLWPGKRAGDEEDGEGEEDTGEGEEGKRDDDGAAGASAREAKGVKNVEDESDSSDDYSSLEGVDLRERAKKLSDEEIKEEVAAKRQSGSVEGPDETSGESSKMDEKQERTGVTPDEEKNQEEMCDLTIL
ncbi:hypothetical protein DPEC_G00187280 [Dallia pectoralis]|uniref:Uncharacterized protein n=1 Tax=Dallia pectoralis TaxID=75939 RepID=A0ACC2GC77_DALPE|nr:hypothetical protein DPEC_G00187280 [Dallia pectoralis]